VTFEPSGFYEFDLAAGAVKTRSGERVLVLTDNVAGALVSSAAPEVLRGFGAYLGAQARGSDDPAGKSPEDVLSAAANVVAIFGFGALRFERWGDALVLRLEGAPDAPMEHVLGGLLTGLGGREVACLKSTDGAYVVVDPSVTGVSGDVATIVGALEAAA